MIRLMVDFNDVQDGIVTGLAESLSGSHAAGVGDRALLHDDGEHEMWATITSVRRGLVDATVEWATWRPARQQRTRTWRKLVPKLSVDIRPNFEPQGLMAAAIARPWSDIYGESTNVCASPSGPQYNLQ